MTRATVPLDAEIRRAVEDVEQLRVKVAAGAPLGDALATAEYTLAGLRRRREQELARRHDGDDDPPDAA